MMTVVTGASSSGKSAFAEELLSRSGAGKKVYAATMAVWDDECRERIRKHRKMRAGKGFITEECPVDLEKFPVSGNTAVLLECMSNLAANEMYRDDLGKDGTAGVRAGKAGERILSGLRVLKEHTEDLVVVTNEVFGDTGLYEEETREYQRLLGFLNQELFSMAETVWEVVCGIPKLLKASECEGFGRPAGKAEKQTEAGREGVHMRFITGGAFQGKRKFAETLLKQEGLADAGTADGETDPLEAAYSRRLVVNFQAYVRRFSDMEAGEARERLGKFLDRLAKENPGAVVVMDEIGCGIVPVEKSDRLWRDLAGEAARRLAGEAGEVYRVTAGIAIKLKDTEKGQDEE